MIAAIKKESLERQRNSSSLNNLNENSDKSEASPKTKKIYESIEAERGVFTAAERRPIIMKDQLQGNFKS